MVREESFRWQLLEKEKPNFQSEIISRENQKKKSKLASWFSLRALQVPWVHHPWHAGTDLPEHGDNEGPARWQTHGATFLHFGSASPRIPSSPTWICTETQLPGEECLPPTEISMPSSFARPRQTAHCLADGESLMDVVVLIKECLVYNAVLFSWVQQRDSVPHTHMPVLFQILHPYRLFENIDYIPFTIQ